MVRKPLARGKGDANQTCPIMNKRACPSVFSIARHRTFVDPALVKRGRAAYLLRQRTE
jgi:hypothetical protein